MRCIEYRGGYKYQLQQKYVFHGTGVVPPTPAPVGNLFVKLDASGDLTVFTGYAWDGASGPAPDFKSIMRGSLAHDALYQLMREKFIDHDAWRDAADRLLRSLCVQDGMWRPFAWIVYLAVRWFGHAAADPAKKRPPVHAPKGCTP